MATTIGTDPDQRRASVGQRLLWMIQHHRSATLSCPLICRITGPLDVERLHGALVALAERHDSLRTTFTGRGHRLAQVIRASAAIDLPIVDLDTDVDSAITAALAEPLDPATATVRAVLWRIDDADHVLCVNMHHLITDAWSCGVLYAELQSLYAGAVPPEPAATFQDFVDWQEAAIGGTGLNRHRDYWQRTLSGARVLNLPPSPDADPPGAGQTGLATADLSPAITERVAVLARERRTTSFVVFLAAYYAQLSAESGRDDLVVATLFGNRLTPRFQGVVGFLATMALLRTSVAADDSFADLIARTHSVVVGAYAHQELPLQMLATSGMCPDGGRVDDLVFQMMTDPRQRGHAGGAGFELILPETIGSRFRLELVLAPVDGGTRVLLYHRTDHLDEKAARGFVTRYADLVDTLSAAPDHRLAGRSA